MGVHAGQHDERAFGVGNLNGRVENQRQHFLQHTARAKGPEPLQEHGDLAQVIAGAGAGSQGHAAAFLVAREEHEVCTAATAQADAVARANLDFVDLFAVDEGAVPRCLVPDEELCPVLRDLGVLARDLAAAEAQIVRLPAANRERQAIHIHESLAQHVTYFQPRGRHNRRSVYNEGHLQAAGAATQ